MTHVHCYRKLWASTGAIIVLLHPLLQHVTSQLSASTDPQVAPGANPHPHCHVISSLRASRYDCYCQSKPLRITCMMPDTCKYVHSMPSLLSHVCVPLS